MTSWPKVIVFDALLHLVENGLAVWHRNASDGLELQVVSGEVFALGDTGITSDPSALTWFNELRRRIRGRPFSCQAGFMPVRSPRLKVPIRDRTPPIITNAYSPAAPACTAQGISVRIRSMARSE